MAEYLEDLAVMAAASDYDAVFDIPIDGIKLGVRWRSGSIYGIDFLPNLAADIKTKDQQLAAAIKILKDYFLLGQSPSALPIRLQGTDHQLRVWQAIQQIPPGAVATYAEIAKHIGSAPRAVGGACRRNPVPIIVPCHRIVASNGIGGFAGAGVGKHIAVKQWLLNHEHKIVSD